MLIEFISRESLAAPILSTSKIVPLAEQLTESQLAFRNSITERGN